jgi:membrane-bound serine protease (ClpP class)
MFAALGFVILEAFLPSAGILSLLAAISVIVSISLAFTIGVGSGVMFLAIAAFGMPLLALAMLKFWPHTPIGQLILIARPENQDDVLPETEEYRGMRGMIGRQGIARSKMLPSGAVAIENRIFDAMTTGVAVEAGELVEVIGVDMGHLIVEPVPENPLAETTAPESNSEPASALNRSLEEFGLDDLEEPLNS